MITIDGSEGEGGGQVLRYACALSLITSEPFTIENIRGGRDKPGLMRQHVTAIEAACAIGGGECEGLAIASGRLAFRPGKVSPGDYHFSVGTAGSTGLVLQTVLVPLMLADAPSRLVIEGGTHAMSAPPFDFIERTLLPVLRRLGPSVTARLVRYGFYPRGGGRIEVEIEPAPLRQIECLSRGEPTGVAASAVIAGVPFDVAQRELKTARRFLPDWPEEAFSVRQLPDDQGPGTVLMLDAAYEQITEVMTGFGKLGVSAEQLAKNAARRMAGYIESTAFAGPYLQDQLLLPFAIAGGGAFTSVKISEHTRTAVNLIERFTGTRFRIGEHADRGHLVEIIRG